MQLSKNFTLEELCFSETATRKGVHNVASDAVVANLKVLADTLEQVRSLLGGNPININSGYRSRNLNLAVGGAATSSHVFGYAVDFTCRQFGDPRKVADKIASSGIKFDQLICEGTWVHLSVDPKMRQEYLSATFKNGKATYTGVKNV